MLRYLRPAIMAGLSLVASAAMALELPIRGEYGDACSGSRSGTTHGTEQDLWKEQMSARGFGLWGQTWRCEFVGADEIPAEMAELATEADRARGWAVRAVCSGLRPIETFLVYAHVEGQKPTITVVHGSGGFRLTFGLCPVRSFLRPAR